MTQNFSDILELVDEIKRAKQQLVSAQDHKEQAMHQFKHLCDQHDQADRLYVTLMHVFEYCVQHDCDPAYAKLMLSDKQDAAPHYQVARGTLLQHLPTAAQHGHAGRCAPPIHPRSIKQKVVDWLLRN